MFKGSATLWGVLGVILVLSILNFTQWRSSVSLSRQLNQSADSVRTLEGSLSSVRGAADSTRIAYERRLAVSEERLAYKSRQVVGLVQKIIQLENAPKDTSKPVLNTLSDDSGAGVGIVYIDVPAACPETTTVYIPRSWWGCFKGIFGYRGK